ncbi:phage tail spike protein [Clostridium botulinum]|uniref:phage tail spike protein n=1 Tax=Clostridium botulinum TaxID=1491 RepID=UPI001C9A700D|nr:phage tail spike protein [Clostridium botulinum]MBY6809038.1 phage tail protein [Clostridium botulinum]MBY6822257.1 phage tail protein [Clostridium botulinum]MBY6832953.1 phage tail protein [Clostridium botulinum]MBY6972181.1 phage tail protein [Clostridium botulinum]HBJ1649416.1 phage tail protein [Clostridium botulinum]
MIQLYINNKQDITKNGIILNPIDGKISNKLNGENELEMDILLDKDGLYKNITRGCIITAPTPDFEEPQAYRIYDTVKNMNSNTLTVYARHIFFDLNKKIIFNKNVQGNGQKVLPKILEDTKFNGHSASNITDIRQYKMRNVINIVAGSEEDSFLNIWGGEIECNNYNLNIPLRRGKDKGIRVSFGYNLEDIEEEISDDEVVTRIYPYSGDLVLSGNTPYVDSPLITKYSEVYEQAIEMSDIKVKEKKEDKEGFNTRAEAEEEMKKRCKKLFDEGADKIKANYKVKMQDLSKTTEYKKLGYDKLEKICLGDTVHCYNKNINIEVSARCISYDWDIVNEEFIDIELGQFLSNYIDKSLSDLDNLYRKIVMTEQFITLRVDSLDNSLHSEIKMTAEQIRSEVVDTKKDLESSITQTAKEIRSEVKDVKHDLSSEIDQQADKISAVVQEGDSSGSWELRKDAFTVAFNKASGEKTEINKNGIQIYEGGLLIKDNRGKNIMGFGDGVATVNDLYVTDGRDKYSWFYKSIAGMEEMEIQDVRIHKLVIDNKAFFIEDKKLGKGYDLKDYIETICYKMLKDQGLI